MDYLRLPSKILIERELKSKLLDSYFFFSPPLFFFVLGIEPFIIGSVRDGYATDFSRV